MSSAAELLRDDEQLGVLLNQYKTRNDADPKAEWYDRVMQVADISPAEISKLHGTLLAFGWIDTRVHHEASAVPGQLQKCYRITREGIRAIERLHDPFSFDESFETEESATVSAE